MYNVQIQEKFKCFSYPLLIYVYYMHLNYLIISNYFRKTLDGGGESSQILNFICYVKMQNHMALFLISNHSKVI